MVNGTMLSSLTNNLRTLLFRAPLVAQGFPEETMQQDVGSSVYVRDPDGNKIELYGKRTAA